MQLLNVQMILVVVLISKSHKNIVQSLLAYRQLASLFAKGIKYYKGFFVKCSVSMHEVFCELTWNMCQITGNRHQVTFSMCQLSCNVCQDTCNMCQVTCDICQVTCSMCQVTCNTCRVTMTCYLHHLSNPFHRLSTEHLQQFLSPGPVTLYKILQIVLQKVIYKK